MKTVFLLFCTLALHSQTGPAISIYSASGGFGLSGTRYFPIGGGANPPNNIESVVQTTISANTTISRLGVRLSGPLGPANVVSFILRKNGADTSLGCSISNPGLSCQDVVNLVPVAAGDLVDVRATFNATVTNGSAVIVTFSIQIGAAGVAPGQITLILAGTCPAGFTEVAALNGKTLIGTTAANGNVGTTGGSDSIVPAGTVAAPVFTGAPLSTHAHELPYQINSNTQTRQIAASVFGTGIVRTATGQAPAGAANTATAAVALTQGVSAGTPAGTVAAPSFTGAPLDNRSAFVRVIFCVKD